MNPQSTSLLNQILQEKRGSYVDGYEDGRKSMKKKVLEILQSNWTGADLSINTCDQHYIDKIKEL